MTTLYLYCILLYPVPSTAAVLQTQEFPLRGIFMFYLILQRFYGLKVLKTLLSLDDDLKAVTLDPAQLQNHGALAWL
jgi:hypothetical protein